MSNHSYIVRLKVEGDNSLVSAYREHIAFKNWTEKNKRCKDSGFDLYLPEAVSIEASQTKLVDLKVKCAVYKVFKNSSVVEPSAYYLYPRSSISKTKFRLANSVGIIDSGYRGNLKIALDCWGTSSGSCKAFHKLVQICMPDLSYDFEVEIVDDLDETERGEGGFGSTGK